MEEPGQEANSSMWDAGVLTGGATHHPDIISSLLHVNINCIIIYVPQQQHMNFEGTLRVLFP